MKKVICKNYLVFILEIIIWPVIIEMLIIDKSTGEFKSDFLDYLIMFILLFILFIFIFFTGFAIDEDGIAMSSGLKIHSFSNEKRYKNKKRWYYFSFGDLAYIDCLKLFNVTTKFLSFSIIIVKKDGKRYEITTTGYSYRKLKRVIKKYFESYKEKHPEKFVNDNLSDKKIVTYYADM